MPLFPNDNDDAADELLERLWDALDEGGVSAEVLAEARDAIDCFPYDADFLIIYGHLIVLAPETELNLHGIADTWASTRRNAYRRATEIDPTNAEAWCEYGVTLDCADQFRNAREALECSIGLSPTAEAYAGLARVLAQIGERTAAHDACDASDSLDDDSEWVKSTIAEVRAGEWDDDDAD